MINLVAKIILRFLFICLPFRFAEMLYVNDYIIAAVADPRFKTSWLTVAADIKEAENVFINAYRQMTEISLHSVDE